jgi:hypothetical protein
MPSHPSSIRGSSSPSRRRDCRPTRHQRNASCRPLLPAVRSTASGSKCCGKARSIRVRPFPRARQKMMVPPRVHIRQKIGARTHHIRRLSAPVQPTRGFRRCSYADSHLRARRQTNRPRLRRRGSRRPRHHATRHRRRHARHVARALLAVRVSVQELPGRQSQF